MPVLSAPRCAAALGVPRPAPNGIGTRGAVSRGESEYKASILGLKRRMINNFDFTATYTLAEAKSNIGTAADELNQNNIQDVALLYDDVAPGVRRPTPTRATPARIAAVVNIKGFTISPIFTFRSPLPISTIDGRDLNLNGEINDSWREGLQVHGFRRKDGDLRRDRTLRNLELQPRRVAHAVEPATVVQLPAVRQRAGRGHREIFNMLNAKNPQVFNTAEFSTTGAPLSSFMQPTRFSGDFQAGEQRVGQLASASLLTIFGAEARS